MTSRLRLRLTLAAGLTAAVVAAGVVPAGAGPGGRLGRVAGAASAPACGITWGSLAKTAPQGTSATVSGVRTGRQDCFDRLVVDLAGGAILQVVVRAPAYSAAGASTVPWPSAGHPITRPDQFDAGGYRTFEDLVWGGSFEGQSTFGLGVRARLPFRVLTLDGPGAGTRLVIDVAHRW